MNAATRHAPIGAVLFDLDGTLLDTAPDLVAACNAALAAEGLAPCPAGEARPYISGGARTMLGYWLVKHVEHRAVVNYPFANAVSPQYLPLLDRLMERMLDHYEANVARHTRYFEGVETVLEELDARGLPWGIVTNKQSRFTDPLAEAMALTPRARCIISGDTTAECKPHPLPLLEASRRLGIRAGHCLYMGDAARDIEAGRRAGMATLAAGYGYIAENDDLAAWGADDVLPHPDGLIAWIEAAP